MSRLLRLLAAPFRRIAGALSASPRESTALLALGAFCGCAIAGAAVLRGLGVALIVASFCALTVALLFGTEDEES